MLDNSGSRTAFGSIDAGADDPRSDPVSSSFTISSTSHDHIEAARSSCPAWRWRLHEEWSIFLQVWPRLFVDAVALLYLTPVLFLNLAYYRFVVRERLPDLGFYYLPELSNDFKHIVDAPMMILNLILAFFLLLVLIQGFGDAQTTPTVAVTVTASSNRCSSRYDRNVPYLINIVDTFCSNFAMGHVLRAVTYLCTTSPGVSRMCLSTVEVDRHRPTLEQVFYRPASFTENCGDLMFSGHLLQMIVVLLVLRKYARSVWNPSNQAWTMAMSCGVLLVLLEAVLIVMARHHYSADVVVALYVTPLMWYSYHLYVKDARPDHEAVAQKVLPNTV